MKSNLEGVTMKWYNETSLQSLRDGKMDMDDMSLDASGQDAAMDSLDEEEEDQETHFKRK
jgi:hypothetical protein